jgi:hypothetical protein
VEVCTKFVTVVVQCVSLCTSADLQCCCRWLAKNKHLRYMWIPYTDTVVVVKCNETKKAEAPKPGLFTKVYTEDEKLDPMRALFRSTVTQAEVSIVLAVLLSVPS